MTQDLGQVRVAVASIGQPGTNDGQKVLGRIDGGDMAQDYTPWCPPERNGAGDAAFTLGVLATIFAFVPIVGDFIALPSALGAVVLGVVGIVRADRGVATNPGKALAGVLLGVISAFITFITIAAMGSFG